MTKTHDKRTETHACDLISRQAAVDEKNVVHMELFGRDFPVVPVATLKRLPPVDAVPVVRCRDCEHKDRESGSCHGRGCPVQLVPDDGFCDKGKRKGGPDEH